MTLIFLRYLLRTNWAPLLCIISILLTSCGVWGAHTVEAYSIIGSTNVLKQCSLIWREQAFRFQRKNARVVLAFDDTCLACFFKVSLESITTPKYLTEFTSFFLGSKKDLKRLFTYQNFSNGFVKSHTFFLKLCLMHLFILIS